CFPSLLLMVFRFFVQLNQEIMTLLGRTLHKGGAVLFVKGIFQLLHALMKRFLIAFFIAIVYDPCHELSHFRSFCAGSTRSRQNSLCYLIEIWNIFLTECQRACCFSVLATGKKCFGTHYGTTGKYCDHF